MAVNINKNENSYISKNESCHDDLYLISTGAIKLRKTKLRHDLCECLITRKNDLTFLWVDAMNCSLTNNITRRYFVEMAHETNLQKKHHASGRVLMTHPGVRYYVREKCPRTGQNGSQKDVLCHQVSFSSNYLNALSLSLIGRTADSFLGQSVVLCHEIKSIIRQIEHENVKCLPGSSFMIRNLGAQLAIALIRNFDRSAVTDIWLLPGETNSSVYKVSDRKDETLTARMREIAGFISQHCSQNVSNETLARRFKMNACYLSRCFSQTFNQTITGYRINCRMELAIKLMHKEGRSITEIAGLCGYQSVSRFSDRFRSVTGWTPTEYRLQLYKRQIVRPE